MNLNYFFVILISLSAMACQSGRYKKLPVYEVYQFSSNPDGEGREFEVELVRGSSFYFPLMAIWAEDTEGNYLQELYVAESIARGVFGHGDASTGKWMPGAIRRPAALPYWGHRRGVPASDGFYLPTEEDPLPDAYTGATPTTGFQLTTRMDSELSGEVMIYLEINQSWDWNEYWTNNRFPGDEQYKTSAQPALVYAVLINLNEDGEYQMQPIGHSHYSGKDGSLNPDLSTLTTALHIAERIVVRVK